MKTFAACLWLSLGGLLAAVITPPGRYTLKYLTWDSAETNVTVYVRLATNQPPIQQIAALGQSKVAISNLWYDTTYYLSASNSAGESAFFIWPQKETNYINRITQAASTINGPWVDIPGSYVGLTNPVAPSQEWRLKIWKSNNLDVYIHPQP